MPEKKEQREIEIYNRQKREKKNKDRGEKIERERKRGTNLES